MDEMSERERETKCMKSGWVGENAHYNCMNSTFWFGTIQFLMMSIHISSSLTSPYWLRRQKKNFNTYPSLPKVRFFFYNSIPHMLGLLNCCSIFFSFISIVFNCIYPRRKKNPEHRGKKIKNRIKQNYFQLVTTVNW